MADTTSAGTVSLTVKPDAGGFGNSLSQQIKGTVGGVGETVGSTLLEGLKMFAGPIIAVTAGLGVKTLIDQSVSSFEDLAGSVRAMQRITGGTTEEVSGLRGAMQLAGMDADSTSAAFRIFSKNLQGTMGDSAATADMALKLGGSFTDASGQLLPMNELLKQAADKFASMPNGIEKTALASELFGRQGTQLIPILNKGASGIEELTAQAKDMGLVLDDASMNSFVEARKASREFDATIQGLQVTIGSALLPVIETFQNMVRDVLIPIIKNVREWVTAHKDGLLELGTSIGAVVLPIINNLASFFTGTLIPTVITVLKWFRDTKGALEAVAIAVGTVVTAVLVYKTITGVIALVTAAQQAFELATYGAVGATYAQGIAAKLTSAIVAFQTSAIVTGTSMWWANTVAVVANSDAGLFAKIGLIALAVAQGLATAAQWAWNAAMTANPIGIVIALIAALVGAIIWVATQTTFFQDVWNGMCKGINAAIAFVVDWVSKNWPLLLGILTGPIGLATLWIVNNLGAIGDVFNSVFTGIGNFVAGVFGSIVSTIKNNINFVIDLINGIIRGINSVASSIKDATGGAINFHIGSIPHLAEGGIVQPRPGGQIVKVAEAGEAEAVIPLSKLGNMQGGGNKTVNYYAAPNTSINAEADLVVAMRRAKLVAGW